AVAQPALQHLHRVWQPGRGALRQIDGAHAALTEPTDDPHRELVAQHCTDERVRVLHARPRYRNCGHTARGGSRDRRGADLLASLARVVMLSLRTSGLALGRFFVVLGLACGDADAPAPAVDAVDDAAAPAPAEPEAPGDPFEVEDIEVARPGLRF